MTAIQLQELLRLPAAERLNLIEALWDGLAESGEALLDVPEAHQRELDRRWAAYQRNPADVVLWEEVKAGCSNGNEPAARVYQAGNCRPGRCASLV
jgi:putative addiction module component (TIGR02574 family)